MESQSQRLKVRFDKLSNRKFRPTEVGNLVVYDRAAGVISGGSFCIGVKVIDNCLWNEDGVIQFRFLEPVS